MLNELSRLFGLEGEGPRPPKPPDGEPKPKKPLDVVVRRIQFPLAGSRRINYGEILKNIGADILNNTPDVVKMRVEIEAKIAKKVITSVLSIDMNIQSGESATIPGQKLEIDEEIFTETGKYFMSYNFIDLSHKHSKISRKRPFWVNEDPPSNGIWKDIIPVDLDELGHGNKKAYATQTATRDWILYYNVGHPAYLEWNEAHEEDFTNYVFEVALPWFAFVDIVENDLDDRKLVKYEISEQAFMDTIDVQGFIEKSSYL